MNETRKTDSLIYEIYGALREDIIGNMRPSILLKEVTAEELKEYIAVLHKNNISFNYVLNSTVTDGREYTSEGRNEIYHFIDKMINLGVDTFTLSSPYLMRFILRNFPGFKINASISNRIFETIYYRSD